MLILVEECANGGKIWYEEEVQQIDVERASTDILQRATDNRAFRKIVLIVAEVHKDYSQKA